MKQPKSSDPSDHETECTCDACKAWWAARGLAVPSSGEDDTDPELEPNAEDDDDPALPRAEGGAK